MRQHRLVAYNTATTSANKIHDDTVARRYGFTGGLVPGVDVYAYLTRAPAEAWGIDWLRRGSLRARFLAPVYDREDVTVLSDEPIATEAGRVMAVELRNAAGVVCAAGEAGLPDVAAEPPPITSWPQVEPVEDPPPAGPDVLAPGTPLALPAHRFHADRAGEYLSDVRERLPLYADAGVAHPGWLLREANHVLSSNVALGPWIHVESVTQHHGVVGDGDMVEARATVSREWERKGHRFVELEVGVIANADRVVARVAHTAIYRPRPTPT